MRRFVGAVVLVCGIGCGTSSSPGGGNPTEPPPDVPDPESLRPPFAELWGSTPADDLNPDPQVVEVALTAEPTVHEFVPGKVTDVIAFNGMIPGPTIRARVGDTLIIHFTNLLDEVTTIHWHGLRITDDMDGTPMMQDPIEPGQSFTYQFTLPDAGSFWYHPHYNTPEQIERGLMGSIIVQEAEPPVFDRERIIFTDDIKLNANGKISAFATAGMDIMHGRQGNVMLLNGQRDGEPTAVRAGARERWRVFNGANGRTMALSLVGAYWRVIGTDGGLLPEPYDVDRLVVPVGQRYDLDVVFDDVPGAEATLLTHVLALDANDNVIEEDIPLQVFTYSDEAPQAVRAVTFPVVAALPPPPEDVTPEKTLVLSGFNDGTGVRFTINGNAYPDEEHWVVQAGTTTRVRIENELGMEHPFHLHGQFFRVIAPAARAADEPGWKDTVLVAGAGNVTIEVFWSNPGEWMYHCHIAEHAEHGMMAHIHVEEE